MSDGVHVRIGAGRYAFDVRDIREVEHCQRGTAVPGARLRWRFAGRTGEWAVALGPDSVVKAGVAEFAAPEKPGPYALRAEMVGGDGQVISENVFEFTVAP